MAMHTLGKLDKEVLRHNRRRNDVRNRIAGTQTSRVNAEKTAPDGENVSAVIARGLTAAGAVRPYAGWRGPFRATANHRACAGFSMLPLSGKGSTTTAQAPAQRTLGRREMQPLGDCTPPGRHNKIELLMPSL